jgi:protein-glutamine gamma-glutamyltransferase
MHIKRKKTQRRRKQGRGGSMLEFLKKIKIKKHPPEDSIPLRISILLMLLTGITAVLHQQEWPPIGYLVIAGTIFGFYYSYKRRNEKNTVLKIILAFLMIYGLIDFLRNLGYSAYDPRVPLANLLLWLQMLHSFDLPSRRDLNYSMLVSLILISVSAVLAINSTVLIYLFIYMAFSSAALIYNNLSRFNLNAQNKTELNLSFVLKTAAVMVLVIGIGTGVVFLFIPRLESMSFRPLPRSWTIRLPGITMGRLFNPGQESSDVLRHKSGKDLKWNPDSYFGFNSYVNLNFRGHLSDDVVMKVKSNKWAYIRGLAFDRYDGTGWEIDGENEGHFEAMYTHVPPHRLEPDEGIIRHWDKTVEIVQMFYIQRKMPNIIFGAYNGNLLFFPAETIYRDNNGGLRSPYYMEEGMVYSIISRYVPMDSDMVELLEKHHDYYKQTLKDDKVFTIFKVFPEEYLKYTQLPASLPYRTRKLAGDILSEKGATQASNLRKTFILANYLRETYLYDLDIPPFPDNRDSVDYFLFEQKRGYCEHFASALVIMLRSQGIPARMIFGYQPGEYDPISGYYSIKQSDAHAWVEVYIPGYSWYSVDPTPGSDGATFSASRNQNRWLFMNLIDWIKKVFSEISISIEKIIVILLGIVLSLISLQLVLFYRCDAKKSPEKCSRFFDWLTARSKKFIANLKIIKIYPAYSSNEVKINSHPAVKIYRKMMGELNRKGYIKEPASTAREFVNNLLPEVFRSEAQKIVLAYESARYGINPPSTGEMDELDKTWISLQMKLRNNQKDQ